MRIGSALLGFGVLLIATSGIGIVIGQTHPSGRPPFSGRAPPGT